MGNALLNSLEAGELETLNGESISITVEDSTILVKGANVVLSDVIASNGIVHVLDRILLRPPTVDEDSSSTTTDATKAAVDLAVPADPVPIETVPVPIGTNSPT